MNEGDKRWEVGVLVGPCPDKEVEALMLTLLDLPEVVALDGAVNARVWNDEAAAVERDRYRAALEQIYRQGRGVHVEIARAALNG